MSGTQTDAALTATTNPGVSAPATPAGPTAQAPAATAPAAAPLVTAAAPADPMRLERDRCAQISAACTLAGKMDMASKFIEEGKTVADVQGILLNAVCAERRPQFVPGTSGSEVTGGDENAAYKAEFKAQKDQFSVMGISEEQYVKSRRIDDGKEVLMRSQVAWQPPVIAKSV